MRIALITDGIWPYVLGGMQKHSYYLCKYLTANRVNVELFHFNQSQYDINLLEFFTPGEREFISPHVIDFPRSLPFPGHYIYNSYRYSKRVFETIKDSLSEYDLVYTKGFTGWHLLRQKRKGLICPTIGVKFHGYEMFQRSPDLKTRLQHLFLLRMPVRSVTQMADMVFSYGGKITGIIKDLGVTSEKIFELPSGVAKETIFNNIHPTGNKIHFVFLGRYERRKGIEELNNALDILSREQLKPFEFHFIGPVPEDKRYKASHVIYHGEVRDKTMLTGLLRNSDVLVCPSWSEGMPNVILEAMAAGLTVIATDTGATNVLVSDSTGWLLDGPDPQVIARTMRNVIGSDPMDIDNKKKNALSLVRAKFTWEILVQKIIERFRK